MVPAQVIVLDSLPRLAGGKVDRRVLDAIAAAQPKIARSAGPPRTPAEIEVAGVFEKVLGITGVGSGDDFFELGGHSLGAVEALAEIRKRFPGAELSLLGFFKDSSVAGLVRALGGGPTADRRAGRREGAGGACCIEAGRRRSAALPRPSVRRSVYAYRPLAAALTTTGAVFGILSRGAAGPALEHLTIEAMADEYADLLRRAWPAGPYRLAGVVHGRRRRPGRHFGAREKRGRCRFCRTPGPDFSDDSSRTIGLGFFPRTPLPP